MGEVQELCLSLQFIRSFPDPLLQLIVGLTKRLLGLDFRERHRKVPRQPLVKADQFRCEPARSAVIELEEAQAFIPGLDCDEGHRFVSFSVTPVACTGLPILFGARSEKLRGAVRPEAPALAKEGLRGIEPPLDYVAAHAFHDRIAGAVPDGTPLRVSQAKARLKKDELLGKTMGFVIGIIVSFS